MSDRPSSTATVLSPPCLSIDRIDDAELTRRIQAAIDQIEPTECGVPVSCLGPTYVALRDRGKLKQGYWCYDLDLDQLLAKVIDGAIARISKLGSDQSIDTIELGFTHNCRAVSPSQFNQTFSNIYRGLRGIELQYKDQLVRYSPTRMIATNLSFRKILDQFLQQQNISFDTFGRRGGLIQAFDTRQVLVFLRPTVTAVTLHRGNRVVPMA
ncbi:MAG: hypothetical protein F6K30_26480, partial [Cyanothece sp. SIO2G6]|nr:hypothetical protein [Cyanothece sp. SIO2G6]